MILYVILLFLYFNLYFLYRIKRKNYIMFYKNDILNSLMKFSKPYNSIETSNVKEITKAWINRWLIKRIKREETLKKLISLGPEYIHNQLFFDKDNKKNNLKKLKTIYGN